jgi:DNA mismatch repair protein MutH
MNEVEYDKSSVKEIFDFAAKLVGHSLEDATNLPADVINSRNRGDLGRLVEKYFFKHNPPNNHKPDFEAAGVELKTTGVEYYKKKTAKGEILKAKERLVLTNINFQTLRHESWYESTLLEKCNLMLILFYNYDKSIPVIEQEFVFQPLLIKLSDRELSAYEHELDFINRYSFKIPESDLAQIRRDWEYIRNKVAEDKAHELSEGDTYYLGACRKGPGGEGESLRKQQGDSPGAKSRAFSFKQGYLSKLLQTHTRREAIIGVDSTETFESATSKLFQDFIGLTLDEIASKLKYDTKSKQRKWYLSKRILSGSGSDISELVKADILLKTVSLTQTGKGREDMSFPAFKYLDIASQEWEESDFSEQIEKRFLFVVFQADKNGLDRLVKTMYWNMPYEDRIEARRVWEETKRRININARYLPSKKESAVSHVRPHAKNGKDMDITPQEELLVKKCFWLNMKYIANIVNQ